MKKMRKKTVLDGVVVALFVLITGIAGIVFPPAAAAQTSPSVTWLDDPREALEEAQREQRPVFLLITGGVWCDPCRWFDENSLSDAGLTALIRSGWIPVRIVDTDPAAAEWNVQRLPEVILLQPDGTEIERMSGITPATLLRERLIASAAPTPGSSGSGRSDDLRNAVFRIGSGMIWNDGGAMWFTQDAGLPPRLEEYDRDEDFLYLRDRPSATVLAITVSEEIPRRFLWRWDREIGDWTEIGPLDRTN